MRPTPKQKLIGAALAAVVLIGAMGSANALPKEGTWELRLTPPSLAGFGQGIGYYNVSCEDCSRSSDFTAFTIMGGAGYFLTKHLELGFSIDFLYGSLSDAGLSLSGYGTGMGPFFRGLFFIHPKVALSPELAILFRYFSGSESSRSSSSVAGAHVIAQVPFEFFLGDMWSLRVGPGYQYVRMSGDRTRTLTVHGAVLMWSVAVYL